MGRVRLSNKSTAFTPSGAYQAPPLVSNERKETDLKSKKWAIRGALLVLVLALALPAFALTGWKTFGSANSTGRGYYGAPYNYLVSTSKDHPKQVRVQVTSNSTVGRSTYVSWTLFCWKGDFTSGTTSGSSTVTISKSKSFTQTFANLPIANPLFCEVTITTSHGYNGNLNLKLQAKYADA